MRDDARIVVVAAGFALWSGGRCVAAARWADIHRLRAYRHEIAVTDALFLSVELVDGSAMELREDAPGFDAFLDRASVTLRGMIPYRAWHPSVAASPLATEGVLLFERVDRGG